MTVDQFAAHVHDWESVAARQYISLACLICVAWEHLLTINHEYTYVWKSRFSIMKCLYLALRYFGLASLLSNHVVSTSLLSRPLIRHSVCATWFAFQSAYIEVLTIICELILVVRVWALWHRSVKIALILFTALACEIIVMVYFSVRINLALEYNDTCLIARTPKAAIGVVIPPILMQSLIWSLTLYKWQYNRDSMHPPPLLELLCRDGSVIFIGELAPLFVWIEGFCTPVRKSTCAHDWDAASPHSGGGEAASNFVLAISATFVVSLSYSANVHALTHSVWSIFATILTIGGSRIVMHMQRLKVPFNMRTVTSDIQLTSYVATGTALVVTGISPTYFEPPDDIDGMGAEFPS